jgi:hypothetical protein
MARYWRYIISTVAGAVLAMDAAALVCVPAGIGADGWLATTMAFGLVWGLTQDRIIGRAEAAWKRLRETPRPPVRDGDGPTLLALFAMAPGPVQLARPVLVLSPYPNPPSWLHPRRRWQIMTVWARRNAELVAEARRLTAAGLLRRAERARTWDGMSLYEITGLGRDVAVRNAERLAAGMTEERA